MKLFSYSASVAVLTLLLCGCDGQQYVGADTVELLITNDATTLQRVKRCNNIPILLGSEVKARYVVESDLSTTITITRDQVEVTFQDPGRSHEPFVVPAQDFEGGVSRLAETPPDGYTVELSSPCTPND